MTLARSLFLAFSPDALMLAFSVTCIAAVLASEAVRRYRHRHHTHHDEPEVTR